MDVEITKLPPHGAMRWLGEFDMEGFALFKCDVCGQVTGLNPYEEVKKHKRVREGAFPGAHSASTTPKCIRAAYELGIWKPTEHDLEMLERLDADNEGIVDIHLEIKPSDEPSQIVH